MSFGSQSLGFRLAANTLPERTRSTHSKGNSGRKGHCITRRYTELIRLCFPCNQVASLDVVPDCTPRPPAAEKGLGDRVFCHSAHTRPSTRGVHYLLHPEDHVLNSLTSTKISTAAGSTLCTMPLRRRGRRISKLSRKYATIEDRRKVQR